VETLDKPIPHFIMRSKAKTNLFGEALDKSPLLVAIHGGPHGHADVSLSYFKYMRLKSGYTILYPNFSGSSSYGRQFLEGALGKIGTLDAEEICACVKQLISTDKTIDASRVYLYGGSYGGYMAGILGARYS
jgi:acylaminoacyl-peptidase